ncbi:MAG TPA: VOC family protein [Anaeromyxobacter sp.]|nr:VOC family protein [Anaeromyxobacter sp.]
MAEPNFTPGMFVWRELATADVDRVRRFYGELFGWSWKGESGGPSGTYWLASRGERQVGGAFQKPPPMALPSFWSSYILVDSVDEATTRCRDAGGSVHRPPADIPNVGRFAVLADRWGAVIQAFRPLPGESAPPSRPEAGTFCWETLVTPEPSAAAAFYGKVYGLGTTKGPNGEATVLTAGAVQVADIQATRPGAPSYWMTYVEVESAERSRDRAVQLGGKVLVPRIEVTGVGTVAAIADPTGAALGLFEPG